MKTPGKATESFETAHSLLNQSLAIWEKFGDRKGIMGACNGIGNVYRRQEKYNELQYELLDEEQDKQNLRRETIFGDTKKQQEIERQ